MAKWIVAYHRFIESRPRGLDTGPTREVVCFRVFPEGRAESWIVQTNPDLPHEVQEESALLIAEALSSLLGI